MPSDQSKMFDANFKLFKIFGVWPGLTPSKYYKYFSFIYILSLLLYFILLTVNLFYTPWKIDLMVPEVIFYFTEITVLSKAITILYMRDKIIDTLNIIDCDEFVGDYENKDGILYKIGVSYRSGWRFYYIISNFTFFVRVFLPTLLALIRGSKTELPVCKYYFFDDEVRDSYFIYLYIYQSFGLYGHMIQNINVDALIAGFMIIAIAQLRLLNNNLSNCKLSNEERKLPVEVQDKIQITKLNKYLRHYEVVLIYCKVIQEMLSATLFFLFSVATLILCVVMCGFLMATSIETILFLVLYGFVITFQIFLPGLLGTHLTYESQEVMIAAYSSEWIPRSELFKRNMKLLIERAKTPIVITGLKMFPLSLLTFNTIIKTAYSFYTLIRNFQE